MILAIKATEPSGSSAMDCSREKMPLYLQVGRFPGRCSQPRLRRKRRHSPWACRIQGSRSCSSSGMRPNAERNDLEGDIRQAATSTIRASCACMTAGPPMGRRRAASSRCSEIAAASSRFSSAWRLSLASMRCSIVAGSSGGSRSKIGAGVLLDLKESRHDVRVVVADGGGLSLQADVGRVGEVELLPPGALLALPGKRHQALALVRVGYPVDDAQVADVSGAGADPSRLQPAELGRGTSRAQSHRRCSAHARYATGAARTQLSPPQCRITLICHFGPKDPVVTDRGHIRTVRYASTGRNRKSHLRTRSHGSLSNQKHGLRRKQAAVKFRPGSAPGGRRSGGRLSPTVASVGHASKSSDHR